MDDKLETILRAVRKKTENSMTTFKRRMTREKVLQALYAYELSKEPINDIMANILSELKQNNDDFEFAKKLVFAVVQNEEELEKVIRHRVAHWEFERIAIIDRMILRMGIAEMMYFPDIPPKVTINEAIEVAKNFSTDNSSRFINGVLDAVLEDFRANKTLNKTGRGLINDTLPREERPPQQQSHPRRPPTNRR